MDNRQSFNGMRSLFLNPNPTYSTHQSTSYIPNSIYRQNQNQTNQQLDNENPFNNFYFIRPTTYSNEDLYRQNRDLAEQVRILSESVSNLYTFSVNTYNMLHNIETILHQNRYFTPLRRQNRYPSFFDVDDTVFRNSNNRLNHMINRNTTNQPRASFNPSNTNTNTNTSPPINTNPMPSTNTNTSLNDHEPNLPSRIESVIFNSLVNTLNNELPNATIDPNIVEVSYSTENVSNDIVNLIRGLSDGETPSNIITTHTTISHNTEIFIKNTHPTPLPDNGDETETTQNNANANEPTNTASESEIDDMCAICRANMNDNEILRKIKKCDHCFHINCLDRWLETKITCPICRQDIRLNVNGATGSETSHR